MSDSTPRISLSQDAAIVLALAETAIPFDLEDLYSPFWGLGRYERPGPTITVYELPPR